MIFFKRGKNEYKKYIKNREEERKEWKGENKD